MDSQFARQNFEIKTPRVLIRTGIPSDAEAFRDFCTNAANFPYGGTQADLTLEKTTKRIATFAQWAAEGKHAWLMMFAREGSGDFIGYGGYNGFQVVNAADFLSGPPCIGDGKDDDKVMADIGIMLDHRYWRQGYGLEILVGLVEYARRDMGAELFRTETDLDNQAWQALMHGAEVGGCVTRTKASYDATKEVLQWWWDATAWDEAKGKIKAKGKWIDVE